MSCCPPGSLPALEIDSYAAKGAEIDLPGVEGLKAYVIGEEGKPAVIVNYDVFGFGRPAPEVGGGRVREVCDLLAASGLYVVLPDYYRGDNVVKAGKADSGEAIFGWIAEFGVADTEAVVKASVSFCQSKGAAKIGAIGFCWGGWLCMRSASSPEIDLSCIVLLHAAPGAEGVVGGSAEALCDTVKLPTLNLPSNQEPPEVLPGGLFEKKMGEKGIEYECVYFEDMAHGWVTRGDMADANTARDVPKAIELTKAFLHKHLK
uniref:Dienelactone hydrolase domain-containing protein n=1 Tax=Coccolithus braarudii TaxID=221442 RepID=A0A7S0L2C9_9EUKA